MKKYNIKLIDLKKLENKNINDIISYIKYNGGDRFDENDASSLVSFISDLDEDNKNGFAISYSIDRIDKEFDLLKIGNETIVNVEMKLSESQDKLTQAKQNYYILSNQYQEFEIYIYSYVSSSNKIYKFDKSSEEMQETTFQELNNKIKEIKQPELPNMNVILNNIYTSPEFFMTNNYVLSNSQEDTKKKILNQEQGIIAIEGCGGTGKSLLALDIYKELLLIKGVLYLVPFAKERIISRELLDCYNIIMSRTFVGNPEEKDIIIIDEAQRIGSYSLEIIKEHCKYLILFFDKDQDVDGVEQLEGFLEKYKDEVTNHRLKQVIRNDSTMDRYARKICGLKKSDVTNKTFDPDKIEIYMSDEIKNNNINIKGYIMIEPTKSKIYKVNCKRKCHNLRCEIIKDDIFSEIIHFEIGKEFEKVLIYMCDGYYVKDNKITMNLPICYGDLNKQLYTIISRATEKVMFVCEDITIYNYLMKCKEDFIK